MENKGSDGGGIMAKRWMLAFLVLGILVFPVRAPESRAAGDLTERMARADALWPDRADLAKTREIISLYQAVLSEDPDNVEALWKLSRAHYWLGGHSPKEKKLAIFQAGVDYAKKAVSIKDDCVACHYWLGICYGVYGEAKGVLKSLSLVNPIKQEMNRVIQPDPDYDQGGAYRMLGRVAHKLPWFAGGSKKKSVEYYKKALEIGPKSYLTHVFLAETYLAMKKRQLAKKELEWVMNAPDTGDPGDREDQQKAREIYEKHFGSE